MACQEWMTDALSSLKAEDCELVLLPEFANAPGLEEAAEQRSFALGSGAVFLEKIRIESARLGCLIAVGIVGPSGDRWFNAVALFDRGQRLESLPEKIHLTRYESEALGLTPGARISVVDRGGLRFGFAPCFDLYFPGFAEAMGSLGVDLILSPSYQRSESADRIRLLAQARALDAGAVLIRSSYAMEDARTGGESLAVRADGTVVVSAGGVAGVLSCEVDPKAGFRKPRSHGQPLVEHRTLIREHRRPGFCLPATERLERTQGGPRPKLCAHRGLSHACPENTLPAFAAALSLGVAEIEFDLWLSRDGVPVVCHDPQVDRTTDGQGVVTEMDWSAIRRLDAGIRTGDLWKGVRMPRFEELIELVDFRAGMNIHLKQAGDGGCLVRMVCDFIRKYGLMDLAYIAGHSEDVLAEAVRYDPEIERACLIAQDKPEVLLQKAEAYECRRVQFSRSVTAEECRRAHDAGLVCNLFYSDEPEDAERYVDLGIDVVLTNRANLLFAAGVSTPLEDMHQD